MRWSVYIKFIHLNTIILTSCRAPKLWLQLFRTILTWIILRTVRDTFFSLFLRLFTLIMCKDTNCVAHNSEIFSIIMLLPYHMLNPLYCSQTPTCVRPQLDLPISIIQLTCRYDLIQVTGFWTRSQNCEKRLLASSVCPSAWNNSAPTGRIFVKYDKYLLEVCWGNSIVTKIRQE